MNELRVVLALVLMAGSASAAELSTKEAVQRTVQSNPTVRAAVLDVQRSAQSLRSEQGRYRPKLLADVTGTSQQTPNLSIGGGTLTQLNQQLTVGAELSQTFSWGTTLSLRVENKDSRMQGPLFAGSTEEATLGPGYLFGARLSVTQPLLRGFGDDVGLAQLRSATLDRRETERARDATASSALSTTLQAYWELWYAQRALQIEKQAQRAAQQLRDETKQRVNAGASAPVDLLTYETQVAELDQSVLDAEVAVKTRQAELGRALGVSDVDALDVSAASPPSVAPEANALQRAEEASYEVARTQLEVERAETSAKSAADATRPKLDVAAWVQTQGLGNQSTSAAFDQLGRFSNVSGNVGLTFELPLSSQQHDGQVQAAQIAVRAANARHDAAVQQVRSDAKTELAQLEQAREKVSLAERTAEVSTRSVEAQQKRFASGTATALEVREAEQTLRRAQLSVERHRVDAVKSNVRLEHLTGDLLVRWGVSATEDES